MRQSFFRYCHAYALQHRIAVTAMALVIGVWGTRLVTSCAGPKLDVSRSDGALPLSSTVSESTPLQLDAAVDAASLDDGDDGDDGGADASAHAGRHQAGGAGDALWAAGTLEVAVAQEHMAPIAQVSAPPLAVDPEPELRPPIQRRIAA